MLKDKRKQKERQGKSAWMERELFSYLKPLLKELNEQIDRRLVHTFFGLVLAIVKHRHRNHGLVMSELGSYLLGPEHGRAGTKRISNLIHSDQWGAKMILDFHWKAGTQRVNPIMKQGERPLVIWDESVIEKPESLEAEGLCAVRSTKAVRLKRIKPGFFNPPGRRPISTAPERVTRFSTSSTGMSSNRARRATPLSVASFRFAPEPTIWMGAASSSTSWPNFPASRRAASPSAGPRGRASTTTRAGASRPSGPAWPH